MRLSLTASQRTELAAAAAAEPRVRRWKRVRALLLRADGLTVEAVASTLGCSQASVYAWTAAWRQHGVAGLREGDHGGGQVTVDAVAESMLQRLLATDPQACGHQATGWTVPLLQGELAQQCTYKQADHPLSKHDNPLADAGLAVHHQIYGCLHIGKQGSTLGVQP